MLWVFGAEVDDRPLDVLAKPTRGLSGNPLGDVEDHLPHPDGGVGGGDVESAIGDLRDRFDHGVGEAAVVGGFVGGGGGEDVRPGPSGCGEELPWPAGGMTGVT